MAQDNNQGQQQEQPQQSDLLTNRLVARGAINNASSQQAPLLIDQPVDLRQSVSSPGDGSKAPSGVSSNDALGMRLLSRQSDASNGQRAVYDAIDRRLSQLPQISEADVETARKRHKRNAMVGALGDGLRALSNLYFTTQGAPSSYVPSGVPEREQERYQRIVNARQAADDERLRLTMLADNLRRQDEAAASKAGIAELDRQYKWARVQQISQRIETDRMNLQLAAERLQQLQQKGASEAEINAATIALRQAQTNLANSRAALVDVQIQYYPRLTDARIGAANRSNRGRTSTSNYTYDPYGNNMTGKTTTVTVDDGLGDVAPALQGSNQAPALQQQK